MDQTITNNQTVQTVPVAPVQVPPQSPSVQKYAGFWRRYFAFAIDRFILGIVPVIFLFPIALLLRTMSIFEESGQIITIPFLLLINLAYYVYFWVKRDGQTIGNSLFGIKVTKEDGSKLDVTTAVVRCFGYIISSVIFNLGFLWSIWDSKKQGWHDKIAKTVVYQTSEKLGTGAKILIVVSVLLPIIIAVLGILAAIALVAINPAKQFSTARDAQRRADLDGVTTAIYAYAAENGGQFPSEITETPQFIGTNGIDLSDELTPDYISVIPNDPTIGTDMNTQYFISFSQNGKLVATAKSEVNPGTDITVSR